MNYENEIVFSFDIIIFIYAYFILIDNAAATVD